jgi:uncharacterized membrane protein YphA (DoxX/SURF4 family)
MGEQRAAGVAGNAMTRLRDVLGHPAVVRSAQLAVGLLLGWAALGKLGDLPAFARDIHNFRIVPVAGENLLAVVLPWIELVTALSLVLGVRARAGALVGFMTLLVFAAAVALALARGLSIECGCFGAASAARVGGAKLLQNLGILLVAGIGLVPPARALRMPREAAAA